MLKLTPVMAEMPSRSGEAAALSMASSEAETPMLTVNVTILGATGTIPTKGTEAEADDDGDSDDEADCDALGLGETRRNAPLREAFLVET